MILIVISSTIQGEQFAEKSIMVDLPYSFYIKMSSHFAQVNKDRLNPKSGTMFPRFNKSFLKARFKRKEAALRIFQSKLTQRMKLPEQKIDDCYFVF